jgi:hypothetical protein
VERNIIIAMFNKNVPEDYNKLFPYVVQATEIKRGKDGFEFTHVPDVKQAAPVRDDNEWVMPSLVNLPMKTALEKLSGRTSKIKVHGSGIVAEQQPRAFEKVRGEAECIIYGRGYR